MPVDLDVLVMAAMVMLCGSKHQEKTMPLDLPQHRRLIESILRGRLFEPQAELQLIETHISSVIIDQDYVYKLKKPVDLGFLDFSSLDKRRFYCDEEVRLNQRLSPDLYVDVLAIYGTPDDPSFSADGPPLEYLVRMRPFPQQAQLDRMLERGELDQHHMTDLAAYVADFHDNAARAAAQQVYGSPGRIRLPVEHNFRQVRQLIDDPLLLARLDRIERWSDDQFRSCRPHFEQRKQQGFVRECHGDLHLRNLAWVDDKALAFDCIEFDPALYWIDVINDVAFLVMDLLSRQQHQLAMTFLNQYLQHSGDFSALRVLPYYLVYRAMVRAKIESITYSQDGIPEADRQQALEHLKSYLALAENLIEPSRPLLILMHGASASGKSTIARAISGPLDGIILRSDVERKRMFGLSAAQDAAADYQQGIYSEQATADTYARLAELSAGIIEAGYTVIVDATFGDPRQRLAFQNLAEDKRCRYIILDLKVPESVLQQRILQRRGDVSDADIKVLEQQLAQWRPLAEEEQAYTIPVDAERSVDARQLALQIRQHCA